MLAAHREAGAEQADRAVARPTASAVSSHEVDERDVADRGAHVVGDEVRRVRGERDRPSQPASSQPARGIGEHRPLTPAQSPSCCRRADLAELDRPQR